MPATTIHNDSAPALVRFDSLSVGDVYLVGACAYSVLPGGAAINIVGDISGSPITPAPSLLVARTTSSTLHYTV